MAAGRYVVLNDAGTTVTDPFLWDPAKDPNWKHPDMEGKTGWTMVPETPARRKAPGQLPLTEQNRANLIDKLTKNMAQNKTYLDLASPTAAQQTNQLARLTRECNALIRLTLDLLEDASDA